MTTPSITHQTAKLYDHLNSICALGDQVPRLTELMTALDMPGTTISSALIRLANCGLLHKFVTDTPPIIAVYFLAEKDAVYVINERRGQNTRARRELIPYQPPKREVDAWEMARKCGY
jgi:hypothetical protein